MAIPPPPTYTPLPPAPDVDAGKAAFNNAANLFVPALPTFGTQLNAIAAWIEDRAEDIETAAGAVEDDATSAAASAAAAEGFKDDAEIAAAAAGAAAGLPAITGKPGYVLRVNLDADGVEFDLGASFAGQRAAYGGTANAITLTTGRAISGTPPAGLAVRFRATAANTGATTIALDGGSAVACRTERGAVLPAGYIRAAGSGYSETIAIYDGTHWIVVPSEPIAPGGSGDVLLLAADSVSSSNNTYATQATSGVLNPGVWAFHVSYSALASTAGRARLIRTDTSGVLVEADSGLDNYSPAMAPMAYAVLDAPTTVELQTSRRANGGTTDLRGVRGTGYKIGGL
jgi:hypothetical protein